jgi:hypothetical protein
VTRIGRRISLGRDVPTRDGKQRTSRCEDASVTEQALARARRRRGRVPRADRPLPARAAAPYLPDPRTGRPSSARSSCCATRLGSVPARSPRCSTQPSHRSTAGCAAGGGVRIPLAHHRARTAAVGELQGRARYRRPLRRRHPNGRPRRRRGFTSASHRCRPHDRSPPASHPASRPRTGASLSGIQASPGTGLTPAGRPELIASTSCRPSFLHGAEAVSAHPRKGGNT